MKKNVVTIKTIAKAANVTPSTVSKALRGGSDISDKRKTEIKELAKKLGYKPNLMARNLVIRKSNIIGVIVPDVTTSFFGNILRGINTSARNHQFETIILVNDENFEQERRNIEFLTNLRVEGMIIDLVPGDHNIDLLKDLSERGMPIIFVDRKCDQVKADSVTTNDVMVGYSITRQFLSEGKRNIVFVGSVRTLSVAKDRFKGYKKALKEFGVTFNPDLQIEVDVAIDEVRLKNKIKDFIKSGQKFDSCICAGGYIAYYTGMVLLETGYSISEDLLLGEFGDNSIVHRLGVPFVTINQFPAKIGEKAFNLLVKRIKNPSNHNISKNIYIKSQLVSHHPAEHEHVILEDI